jgi:hypothetical protein
MCDFIIVTGYAKTGSSTLVAIFNSSDSIFVFYEAYMCKTTGPDPRGVEFLNKFQLVNSSSIKTSSLKDCYLEINNQLQNIGFTYTVIGDKILVDSFSDMHLEELKNLQCIYMIRDIRTWLCKNIIVHDYNHPGGIASKACDYVRSYINTFSWQKCLRIKMEDLILKNKQCIEKVFTFLCMEMPSDAKKWWLKAAKYPLNSPKSSVPWWNEHDSSRLKPSKLDTIAFLRSHDFWDELLPNF